MSLSFVRKISIGAWVVLLALLPVTVLPFTGNWYDPAKWFMTAFMAGLTLFLWAGNLMATGRIRMHWSGTAAGLAGLAGAGFLSVMVSSTNKTMGMFSLFGPVPFLALFLILCFGKPFLTDRMRVILRAVLGIEAGLVGIFILYQRIGIGGIDQSVSPLGSPVGTLLFLILCLPILIAVAYRSIREQSDAIAAVSVVAGILTIAGIAITLWAFPAIWTIRLPLTAGLSIMETSWDSLLHGLAGVGPEGFFPVFTRFRPSSFNNTPIWNIGFTANASLALQIGTTFGLTGLAALFLFLFSLVREWMSRPVTLVQAILVIALTLAAPPSLTLLILPVLFLLTDEQESVRTVRAPMALRIAIPLILAVGVLSSWYLLFGWYRSERLFYQSIASAKNGDGTQTFALQEQAVRLNPANPTLHIALSQTTLLLIQSIVREAPTDETGKPNLSDEDKKLVTDLVARSTQEAKIAVSLSPVDVQTWVNAARIYQGLIGIVKDTHLWAIAAYEKAVSIDPTNAMLHLDFGGLYMMLGRMDEGGGQYLSAISLKPDFAAAYYNIAQVYKQKNDRDNALQALEKARTLVAPNSNDWETINAEIDALFESN